MSSKGDSKESINNKTTTAAAASVGSVAGGETKSTKAETKTGSVTSLDPAKEWEEIKRLIQQMNQESKGTEKKIVLAKKKAKLAEVLVPRLKAIQDFIKLDIRRLTEYLEISQLLFSYINARPEIIDDVATNYFEERFKRENKRFVKEPIFTSKRDGDQMGKMMTIFYQEAGEAKSEHQISYYIKTHQYGSKAGETQSGGVVDPKELFIYKFFEYLGVGPKTHFLLNLLSSGGFYIATQDMAFTKVKDKEKSFLTYASLKDDLQKMQKEKKEDSNFLRQAEKGVGITDMLSRIFHLRDVSTNTTNFGCVSVGDRSKWKIIDFRVDTMDFYGYENILKGLQEGNGTYEYTDYLAYVVKDRAEIERARNAYEIMKELETGRLRRDGKERKKTFHEAMVNAYGDMVKYIISHHGALNIKLNNVLGDMAKINTSLSNVDIFAQLLKSDIKQAGDLGKYVRSAFDNFNVLSQGIHKWHLGLSGSSAASGVEFKQVSTKDDAAEQQDLSTAGDTKAQARPVAKGIEIPKEIAKTGDTTTADKNIGAGIQISIKKSGF